jgi:hypothetical protein
VIDLYSLGAILLGSPLPTGRRQPVCSSVSHLINSLASFSMPSTAPRGAFARKTRNGG